MLSTDLFVALGILAIALLPISYSFLKEQQVCRGYYERALANQIVDGEMEVLAAGEWRALSEGKQDYAVSTRAGKNLQKGRLAFSRSGNFLRLEWHPDKGETIIREATGK